MKRERQPQRHNSPPAKVECAEHTQRRAMDEVELFFSLLLGASIIVIVYKLAQRTGGGGGGGGGGPLRPAGSLPRSWSNSEGGVIVDRYSTVEQVHRVKLPATQTQVARREPWHTGQSPGSSARYRERHRDRETERDSDRGREGESCGARAGWRECFK